MPQPTSDSKADDLIQHVHEMFTLLEKMRTLQEYTKETPIWERDADSWANPNEMSVCYAEWDLAEASKRLEEMREQSPESFPIVVSSDRIALIRQDYDASKDNLLAALNMLPTDMKSKLCEAVLHHLEVPCFVFYNMHEERPCPSLLGMIHHMTTRADPLYNDLYRLIGSHHECDNDVT